MCYLLVFGVGVGALIADFAPGAQIPSFVTARKTASSQQDCKFTTRLQQVNANELATTRQTCYKFVASKSLQTIAKTEYADKPPTTHFTASRLSHSASWTLRGEDRLR
ncbi:hypothetical protein AVEN_253701-1 [Araneus ventricosus]|uniref:Secreted protein n=1 Tax=Araneus ventricosus TaxID=182803 RepID=A0A4Y2DY03_ARAVE|nr:hypothetical protein AVEN_253701-1 [Araneus ventricosus]